MKRIGTLSVLCLGLAIGSFAFEGCSSDDKPAAGVETKKAPAKPSAPATTDTSTKTFGVKTLFLGDAPRSGGAPTTTAWKKFGYDLDGKYTTKDSTDVCQIQPGSDKSYREDGDKGIDNSFGANIVNQIIHGLAPNAPQDLNNSIAKGQFTLMFTITGLSDDAKQTATGLSGYLNAGGQFDPSGQTTPTFSSADNWPVAPELLTNTSDPKSSKIQFSDAYVVDGTFVSGGGSDAKFGLTLSVSGQHLDLNIYRATITFDHTAAAVGANGIIAGILNTEELLASLGKIAGRLDPKLCDPSQFTTLSDQIRSFADIMVDGQQDPSKRCDGISIALGFDSVLVQNPTKVSPPSQGQDTACSGATDAGADTGTKQDTGAPPSDAGAD